MTTTAAKLRAGPSNNDDFSSAWSTERVWSAILVPIVLAQLLEPCTAPRWCRRVGAVLKPELGHPLLPCTSGEARCASAQPIGRAHIAGEVVSSELVGASLELSDGAVAVDVDVSGTAGDTALVVEEDALAAVLSVEAGSCGGVEVEETNGGACWM